jgi:hypothetical protein
MNPADRNLWLDFMAARYLEAVERNDFDEQDRLWEIAGTDAELEEAFHQLHLAWAGEAEQNLSSEIADSVTKHLRSAEIIRPNAGPVTVADLANEIFLRTPDKLPAEAHQLNEKLRQVHDVVPDDVGLNDFIAWIEERYGNGLREYWRAMHDASMKLDMQRSSEIALAARRAKPKGDT